MKSILLTKNTVSVVLMAAVASISMNSAQAGSGVSRFYSGDSSNAKDSGEKSSGVSRFFGGDGKADKKTKKSSGASKFYGNKNMKAKSWFDNFTDANIESKKKSKVGYSGFKNPVYGYEVGVERQLEVLDDNSKFVNRTMARIQGTVDWENYKDERGSTVDTEFKGGVMIGHYKGSDYGSGDSYGSRKEIRTGFTGEVATTYTYNTEKVDPFLGASVDMELGNNQRIEWQGDAIAGVKFNVSDNRDLSVRYQKTLAHGLSYFDSEKDVDYRQDDGFAVALIGEQRNPDGTTQTLKVEYERFEKSDMVVKSNGSGSYEPEISNIMVSYKKTF